MGGACSMHGRDEEFVQNFSRTTCGEETTWTPGRRWEDNIKVKLREPGCDDADCFNLAEDMGQVRGPCEHGYETSDSTKGGKFLH